MLWTGEVIGLHLLVLHAIGGIAITTQRINKRITAEATRDGSDFRFALLDCLFCYHFIFCVPTIFSFASDFDAGAIRSRYIKLHKSHPVSFLFLKYLVVHKSFLLRHILVIPSLGQ